MVSTKGYGQLRFKLSTIKKFKECREPDETRSDTLDKLIENYQKNKNRKRPDCSDPGINQTIAEST